MIGGVAANGSDLGFRVSGLACSGSRVYGYT